MLRNSNSNNNNYKEKRQTIELKSCDKYSVIIK